MRAGHSGQLISCPLISMVSVCIRPPGLFLFAATATTAIDHRAVSGLQPDKDQIQSRQELLTPSGKRLSLAACAVLRMHMF